MRWKNRESWNFCGIHYINMVDTNGKMCGANGIEAIADNDGILQLN